ncbi:MAG: aminoacyl-tRNA hydrolase [Bacteroidales bacterium]|nr:aminoacyl-tRNA hydrolase [Bacteroidales bacterium]
MKYLIVGLGNIGAEYAFTRHNIGFMVADALCHNLEGKFVTGRLAQHALLKYRSKPLVVIKPTTFMNLSGKAVQYWLRHEDIPVENMLVLVDDIALPTGQLRMKKKGGDAGHNGLNDIIQTLGTNEFARLRFGIGDDFPKGRQVDYVLGEWSRQESDIILPKIDIAVDMIKSFVAIGIERTMTAFNNK